LLQSRLKYSGFETINSVILYTIYIYTHYLKAITLYRKLSDIHFPVLCCCVISICTPTRHSSPFCRELHCSHGWKHCALFTRTVFLLSSKQLSFL